MIVSDFFEYMKPGKRGHLVGIGGVSMSALGEVLFSMGNELFCVGCGDACVKRYTEKAFCDESSFVSEMYDFDCPLVRKNIKGILLDIEMSQGSEMVLTLYSDGKAYYSCSIYSSGEGRKCVDINLPDMSLYRFSYGLCMENGFFELNSAAVKAVFDTNKKG